MNYPSCNNGKYKKAVLCLVFVFLTILITGCTAVSDGPETTDEEVQVNGTTDSTDNSTENNGETGMTKENGEHELTLSGFVAEDVPENATIVEYNGSSIEDSGFITRLLEEIRTEGRGSARTKDRHVVENASELYGNLPIFVPEDGAVRGPDGSPYPSGVYVRYKNETVFFTDGIETL